MVPFWVPQNTRCRNILRTQNGTITLITAHIKNRKRPSLEPLREKMLAEEGTMPRTVVDLPGQYWHAQAARRLVGSYEGVQSVRVQAFLLWVWGLASHEAFKTLRAAEIPALP